ncbi:MAG TPA: cupredoxin domain-containing protein [Polyangia bacterium]|jgi:plastocyanin domain-containing protein|nr:cupredoxin domain-containing protein [Polyangia bacterium]
MRRALMIIACLALPLIPGCSKEHAVDDQVTVEMDASGFHPDTVWAKKGRTITINFKRTEEVPCGNGVLIAAENLRRDLPLDQTVPVSLLPGRKGKLHFACPQNAFGGDIVVQ